MWSSLVVVIALLTGCSSQPEAPEDAPAAALAKGPKGAKSKGKAAKGKAKGKAKGAKGAKGAKAAKRAPAQAPIGVEGPLLGELKLTKLEEPTKAPPAPPAEGAADEAVEGEAPAAPPPVEKTQADLVLTFGEDGEATVMLGKVKGVCTEVESVPVGPEGKQQTPLWTVRCGTDEKHTDLFILQAGESISVVREVPAAAEGAPVSYRPVKRVPLVKGAELQRKG